MFLSRLKLGLTSVTLALAVGGCSMGPELEIPITQNSNERVSIRWAHAYQRKHGIEVWGQVRRRNYSLVRGHIHIEALGQSGTVLAQADAYLPKMVRHPFMAKSFGARLLVNDATAVSQLLVEVRSQAEND